jgi:hypothetical protein
LPVNFSAILKASRMDSAVGLAAAEVVDLAGARGGDEGGHEAGDVEGVDVVAHLLALVAEDLVLAALEIAFHEVAEEAVEFDAAVIGAGEAAAAQRAGGQVEVAAVLLDHHVGGDLRGAEQRVLRLVDGERLRDAVGVGGIGVVPARGEFPSLMGSGRRRRPCSCSCARTAIPGRPGARPRGD